MPRTEIFQVPGVAGAHLMAPRQEAEMAAAIEFSGVLRARAARAAAAGRA